MGRHLSRGPSLSIKRPLFPVCGAGQGPEAGTCSVPSRNSKGIVIGARGADGVERNEVPEGAMVGM